MENSSISQKITSIAISERDNFNSNENIFQINRASHNFEMNNSPVINTYSNLKENTPQDLTMSSEQNSDNKDFFESQYEDQASYQLSSEEIASPSYEPLEKTNKEVTKKRLKMSFKTAKTAHRAAKIEHRYSKPGISGIAAKTAVRVAKIEHRNSKPGISGIATKPATQVSINEHKNTGKMKKKSKWISQFEGIYQNPHMVDKEIEATASKDKETSSESDEEVEDSMAIPFVTSTGRKSKFLFEEIDYRDIIKSYSTDFSKVKLIDKTTGKEVPYTPDYDWELESFFPVPDARQIPMSRDTPSASDLINEILDQNEGLKEIFLADFLREKNKPKSSGSKH